MTNARLLLVSVVVMILCVGCNRDAKLATGLFEEAIAAGDLKRAESFLERGADINYKYPDSGHSTLLIGAAAGSSDDSPIVKFLLDHGANPNLTSETGTTALLAAAKKGRFNHVKLLLAAGADPLVKDNDGRTALEYAQAQRHEEIVRVLAEIDEKQI